MRTKHTMCRKRNRGVSTILGTLIFVGIIFSAYVPMTLVMKQADNIYERAIHEAKIGDIEKANEDVMVVAYGAAESTELSVYVTNRGSSEITITRVWLNDDPRPESPESGKIAPKTSKAFGSYGGLDTESPLKVKVTTDNGNIFECNLGTISYGEYGWYTPSFAVSVMILNDWGQYEIIVDDSELAAEDYVGYYKSSGNEQDEITKTFLVSHLGGNYYVWVQKRVGGDWIDLIGAFGGAGQEVTLVEGGNPVAIIVVDGT